MQSNNWTLFVEGYADAGEKMKGTGFDAYMLSAKRAQEVTKALVERGVRAEKITTLFYGDSRVDENAPNMKVQFILRKRDMRTEGKKVSAE